MIQTKLLYSIFLILLFSTFSVSAVGITLHDASPDPLSIDYCGLINISYIVEHSVSGIDYTTMAFLSGINYTPTQDYKMCLRVPSNDLADMWSPWGKVLRNQQRNLTPYLTWEFNNTITEGNHYKWGGGDHNSTWISQNNINSTHTFVNISGQSPCVYPSMHYLSGWEMYNAVKIPRRINKWNGLLFKVWDNELMSGRDKDYYVRLCIDTVASPVAPGNDIELWWANNSFDPTTDDPTNTVNGGYIGSINYSTWMNHQYSPSSNSNYAPTFNWWANLTTGAPQPTGCNYLYLWADVSTSQSYYMNITNVATQTNLSFAQTNVLWNRDHNMNNQIAYTPSLFLTYPRNHEMLEMHLYVQDNDSSWYHSPINQIVIGMAFYPPNSGIIRYFDQSSIKDYVMTGCYMGNLSVGCECGNDPDGGAVTHSMDLYDNSGFVVSINASFSCNGASSIEIPFNTTPYVSNTTIYHLLLTTTDNELDTVTSTSPNFQIKEYDINMFESTNTVLESVIITLNTFIDNAFRILPLVCGLIVFIFVIGLIGVFTSSFKKW